MSLMLKQSARVATLASGLAFVLAGNAFAADLESAAGDQPAGDPNRVWIRFQPGAKSSIQSLVRDKLDALRASLKSSQGARAAGLASGTTHFEFDNLNSIVMTLPPQVIEALRKNKNLVIEQDPLRYPASEMMPWGVPAVQGPDAVAVGADGSGVKVCVIDSGILATHEDFAGIAMSGTASNGKSWNTDNCGHGTHVAGTIAAVGNNSAGVVGVSPGKVSLHIVKYFDGPSCAGGAYASGLVSAAQACAAAGAKVINMSLKSGLGNSGERDAFAKLVASGVLPVAAAGNDSSTSKSYPASYPSVLSVGAIDRGKNWASFSNYNSEVDVAAPGVDITSTYPMKGTPLTVGAGSYATLAMAGTATATVSGALVDGGTCDSRGSWSKKIVLCTRGGTATSAEKAGNARAGGAVGVVLVDTAPGFAPKAGTLTGSLNISGVAVSQDTGAALRGLVGQTAVLNPTMVYGANDAYANMQGTSMASPHVAGVAALLFSAKPSATVQQVRDAITSTALDLETPGRDDKTGAGMVRAFEALDKLLGNK
ncbi:S8 family serine peptidase [Lysobacter enzymogenes]|uniref:S8 family serine peptidase n=1 Tax=Lysobacter enzymogenes TaxID=69 RepID=UPI001A978C02|nr:S8 family serine peptidase [Lysobacter enzymogenes]QQP95202.1 S8 family serine peptidase [Lysobacter enzymogenes]